MRSKRTVKLPLTKKEINHLAGKAEVKRPDAHSAQHPYFRQKIKAEIGLTWGRRKKKTQKREKIKKRDTKREMWREMKGEISNYFLNSNGFLKKRTNSLNNPSHHTTLSEASPVFLRYFGDGVFGSEQDGMGRGCFAKRFGLL